MLSHFAVLHLTPESATVLVCSIIILAEKCQSDGVPASSFPKKKNKGICWVSMRCVPQRILISDGKSRTDAGPCKEASADGRTIATEATGQNCFWQFLFFWQLWQKIHNAAYIMYVFIFIRKNIVLYIYVFVRKPHPQEVRKCIRLWSETHKS